MNRLPAAIGVVLVCGTLVGCGGRAYPGERRFPLAGKVTIDGQPMEHGLISFVRVDNACVAGGPITNGAYAISEEKGAIAGQYRVEIHWNKPTGKKVKDAWGEEIMDEFKEGLPAKYHKDSGLTAEVSSKRTNFDFDLKSK